jgi:hypothetical protein
VSTAASPGDDRQPVDDPAAARAALDPLLALDLVRWQGLPRLTEAAVVGALGEPSERATAQLGWYPAERAAFTLDLPSGGLDVYLRDGHAVLVETRAAPGAEAPEALGPPTATLSHEILEPGAYVHELVYAQRGLVLSVAEPLESPASPASRRIVRCRGTRPLRDAADFGPEFRMAFEDRAAYS